MNGNKEIEKQIKKIKWWHRIPLGNGVVTPGRDMTEEKLATLDFPLSFSGKTVLDIGAWDGFFSFEAEARGAKRVIALDSYAWNGKGWSNKNGFLLAKKLLKSDVKDIECEVEDITPKTVGRFNIVLFLGVLYHMKNPLKSLECVASVTKELLIIETHADMIQSKIPLMKFYRAGELDHDATSYWGPNPVAIETMLKVVGFKKIEMVYPKSPHLYLSFPYRLLRALKHKLLHGRSFFQTLTQCRVVYHAWK